MATAIVGSGGFGIDTTAFRDVAKALRFAGGEAPKNLRRSLRAAGEIVAVEAKSIASEHSSSIPPTIKVRVTGATVSVVAGNANVPLAGLYELGNYRVSHGVTHNRGGDSFRHPVFVAKKDLPGPDGSWVDQPSWQFLKPAALNKEDELEVAVTAVLDDAVKTICLTPSEE